MRKPDGAGGLSNTRQLLSFFFIAIGVSAALAYIGGFWSVMDGSVGSNFAWEYLAFGPIYLAPFYAIFLVLGGLLVGLPALGVLRSTGRSTNPRWLIPVGLISGGVTGLIFFGLWLGPETGGTGGLFGALGGVMSAAAWYLSVERYLEDA